MRGFFYFNIINVVKLEQIAVDSIDPIEKVVLPQKTAESQREADRSLTMLRLGRFCRANYSPLLQSPIIQRLCKHLP